MPPSSVTVDFTYDGSANGYPFVCGTGTLSCTGTESDFACTELISGTHYYFPDATDPTVVTPFTAGALPAQCGGYSGDNELPIDNTGLSFTYGSSCSQLFFYHSKIRASPDDVVQYVSVTYNTSAAGVASCPTPIVPAESSSSSSSGGAVVGPASSSSSSAAVVVPPQSVTVYFTYDGSSNGYPFVCGTGILECSGEEPNFACTELISGTHYYFPDATDPTVITPFGNGTLPAQCGGFTGDNDLPIDGNGLSFVYGSECSQLYLSHGNVRASPDDVVQNVVLTYNTSIEGVASCPAPILPYVSSSTGAGSGEPVQDELLELIQLFPINANSDVVLDLDLNADSSAVFVSTFLGAVYRLSLPITTTTTLSAPLLAPSSSADFTQDSHWWRSVVIDPTESRLYLLDQNNGGVYVYAIESNTLTQLCSFPDETPQSLSSLSVDFTQIPVVAYVTSEPKSLVYAVNTQLSGQTITASQAYFVDTANGLQYTSSTLHVDAASRTSTLYLTSKVLSSEETEIVLSTLAVSGTTPTAATSTTPLFSSTTWDYPDAIVVSKDGSLAYVMDGGYRQGFVVGLPPFEVGMFYECQLTASPIDCITINSTDTLFLRGGLALTEDQSTLVFGATYFIEQLVVNASAVTGPLLVPGVPQSSSSSAPPSSESSIASSAAPSESSSAAVIGSSSAAATSTGTGVTIPGGGVITGPTTIFPLPGDSLTCLTSDTSRTVGFAASVGGAIYIFDFTSIPFVLNYSYVAGDTSSQSGSYWADCVASLDGSVLYLLDSRESNLYSYLAATPAVGPVLLASFTDEQSSALTSLAIDFTANLAYVGTTFTAQVYLVDITIANQIVSAFASAAPAAGNIDSLTLSADGTTLYYGVPSPSQGAAGSIFAVLTADIASSQDASTTAILVVNDTLIISPDTLLVQGDTLYIKDGGAQNGDGNGGAISNGFVQSIFNFSLATANTLVTVSTPTSQTAIGLTTLFTTTTLNLPKGLSISFTGADLFLTTTDTIDALALVPNASPPFPPAPTSSSSSSSSVPVTTTAASSTAAASSSAALSVSSSSTSTGARAIGDPLFAGFQGQLYQVHGIDGAIYAVLSQSSLHINALFVFLSSGSCPVVSGVTATTNCWSHPGSYFGQLSFQTAHGSKLQIEAGSTTTGVKRITLDGQVTHMTAGNYFTSAQKDITVTVISSHALSITVGNYELTVDNSDNFLNLAQLRVVNWGTLVNVEQPHGLLGQSWTRRSRGKASKQGKVMQVNEVVEGDVDDYVIQSDTMFGTDFVYTKFEQQ